ncbi:MAG: UTP--glucose-1-phosphate uridylyltransferase [Pirellula sp.]
MKIRKAVVTAAGVGQGDLLLQKLVDRDGRDKTVLEMIIEEIDSASIDSIAFVIDPESQGACIDAAGSYRDRLVLVTQGDYGPGYGQAILSCRDFVGNEPFLHMVGDHLCYSRGSKRCAAQLCEVASQQGCSISAVQETRESQLPYFGTVGGVRIPEFDRLFEVKRVMEKPTPTLAEQELLTAGLRNGNYLCFFGMHVLMPSIFRYLIEAIGSKGSPVSLTEGIQTALGRERYLAYEIDGQRYNLGVKFGLFSSQLALGLSGVDRDRVMSQLIEVLSLHR